MCHGTATPAGERGNRHSGCTLQIRDTEEVKVVDGLHGQTTATTSALGIQALGAVRVSRDDVEQKVGGGRQRRLLALLLIHRDTVVSVDRVAEVVFEGNPTDAAATTLRSYVARCAARSETPSSPGHRGTSSTRPDWPWMSSTSRKASGLAVRRSSDRIRRAPSSD